MVEVLIFSNKGHIQKESFATKDLAHAGLLDVLRGKICGGETVFAVMCEDSVSSYAVIEDNTIVVFSAKDFFEKKLTKSDFDALKELLFSDAWPHAVYSAHIADENSEKDKDERAEGIVDILLPPLGDKKFLDFGCGEGHVANYISKSAKISVGYDIIGNQKSRFSWEEDSGSFLLTTDFKKVEAKGPYDFILIYDVLDHAQNSTPQEILTMARSVLANGGKIYLRTHPWTARHGGHAYRKINKAFAHLVFTEEELKSMGIELEHNIKSMKPIDDFNTWLKGSGLKKSLEPELDQQEVEPFFKENPIVRKRILNSFGVKEWTEGLPEWQMSQCFWDYVLEKE